VTKGLGHSRTYYYKYTGLVEYALDELGHSYQQLHDENGQDPIGYAAGDLNLYGYVKNDPVNSTDPAGLCKRDGNSFRDIFEGAEFGFKAAGVVIGETFKIVAQDVLLEITSYIPPCRPDCRRYP
jgi:RHS repeat-associated protein